MPKVSNWSRIDAPAIWTYAWQNDESGEKVAVTEKVPGDGYYVLRFSNGQDLAHSKGERIGIDSVKKHARSIAVHEMREHPDGFETPAEV